MFYFVKNLLTTQKNRTLIFMYHRVALLEKDPLLLATSPENFDKQMEYLKQNYTVLTLKDLALQNKEFYLPDKSVIITFDDGYIDNFTNAKPILEKYAIPATFFISALHVTDQINFWWEVLIQLFFNNHQLPSTFSCTIRNKNFSWNLDNDFSAATLNWNASLPPTSKRIMAFKDLHNLFHQLTHSEQQTLLQRLIAWAKISINSESSRAMTTAELKELSKNKLFEIGSHGLSHTVLANLSKQKQYQEIVVSKEKLEDILKTPIFTFSYPTGTYDAIGRHAMHLAKKTYALATANFESLITTATKPNWLPRYIVRNWSPEKFSIQLKTWFNEQ